MARVLITECDPELASALVHSVSEAGHEARTAFSVEELTARLVAEPIDVCVAEMRVGQSDGPALLKLIHTHSPSTGVVFMSANASPRDYRAVIDLGAVEVLSKPVRRDELEAAIKRAVESRAGIQGIVHGLTLFDVVQMFHLARRSLQIRVGTEGSSIHLVEGELVHAEHAGTSGVQALKAIFSGNHGSIRTAPAEEVPTTLRGSFEGLVLDIFRELDEERSGGSASDSEALYDSESTSYDSSGDIQFAFASVPPPPLSTPPPPAPAVLLTSPLPIEAPELPGPAPRVAQPPPSFESGEAKVTGVVSPVPVETTPSNSVELRAPAKRRSMVWPVSAALVVLVAGAFFMTSNRAPPSSPPTAERVTSTRQIRLDSTPSGIELVDGKTHEYLGTTPFTLEVGEGGVSSVRARSRDGKLSDPMAIPSTGRTHSFDLSGWTTAALDPGAPKEPEAIAVAPRPTRSQRAAGDPETVAPLVVPVAPELPDGGAIGAIVTEVAFEDAAVSPETSPDAATEVPSQRESAPPPPAPTPVEPPPVVRKKSAELAASSFEGKSRERFVLMEQRCSRCHSVQVILDAIKSGTTRQARHLDEAGIKSQVIRCIRLPHSQVDKNEALEIVTVLIAARKLVLEASGP
ncbi:MAG: response regulator [Deltaproteobacteria bacterium]|nr:response regulator [Deltaproteobacteria bacterium]